MGLQTPPGSFLITGSRRAEMGTLAEYGSFQRRLTVTIIRVLSGTSASASSAIDRDVGAVFALILVVL
jgi:hypothetical protein